MIITPSRIFSRGFGLLFCLDTPQNRNVSVSLLCFCGGKTCRSDLWIHAFFLDAPQNGIARCFFVAMLHAGFRPIFYLCFSFRGGSNHFFMFPLPLSRGFGLLFCLDTPQNGIAHCFLRLRTYFRGVRAGVQPVFALIPRKIERFPFLSNLFFQLFADLPKTFLFFPTVKFLKVLRKLFTKKFS